MAKSNIETFKFRSRNNLTVMPHALIIPFVLYLVGTSIIKSLGIVWYPIAYCVVVAAVTFATWFLILNKGIIKPHGRIHWGLLVGIVGITAWIFISHLHLEDHISTYLPNFLKPESRTSYNPFVSLKNDLAIWLFLGVRIFGIAIVVPIIEEVFWRGFLLRWLIDPEWQKIPVGTFTLNSCLILTLLFSLAHPEWFAAAAYCLLLNGLLYWKRDLWLCIVAHATSNLVLAIYVLATGNWWLW